MGNSSVTDPTAQLFLDHSISTLERMTGLINKCLDRLTDEQIWSRGSDPENAIGNLVLHLCGNVRQWIGHCVGGHPDVRVREAEFAAGKRIPAAELKALLRCTVDDAIADLRAVTASRLLETTETTAGPSVVLSVIYRVVGHFQQHTGQIIHAAKSMLHADLGLDR